MNYAPLSLLTEDSETYKNIDALFEEIEDKEMASTVLIGNENLPEKFRKEISDKYGYRLDSWVKLPSFAIQDAYASIAETIFNPEFITEISLRTEAKKSMSKL